MCSYHRRDSAVCILFLHFVLCILLCGFSLLLSTLSSVLCIHHPDAASCSESVSTTSRCRTGVLKTVIAGGRPAISRTLIDEPGERDVAIRGDPPKAIAQLALVAEAFPVL